MKIILLRHGKPDITNSRTFKAKDFHEWIKLYNSSQIDPDSSPSPQALKIAKSCNTVICSDLARSINSAHHLEINKIDYIDPLFREAELPYGDWNTPELNPYALAVFFRILWFMGYSRNSESYPEARVRSKLAASKLENLALEFTSVLLVGHGFMNRFISKELLSTGWKGALIPAKNYWSYTVYEK